MRVHALGRGGGGRGGAYRGMLLHFVFFALFTDFSRARKRNAHEIGYHMVKQHPAGHVSTPMAAHAVVEYVRVCYTHTPRREQRWRVGPEDEKQSETQQTAAADDKQFFFRRNIDELTLLSSLPSFVQKGVEKSDTTRLFFSPFRLRRVHRYIHQYTCAST